MKFKYIFLLTCFFLAACSNIKDIFQESPVTMVTGTVSIEKVLDNYSEAKEVVSSVCAVAECPAMHAALDNIQNLMKIQAGSTADTLEADYQSATASYLVIRGEVGDRFDQLSADEQNLLTEYDAQVVAADMALRKLWAAGSRQDKFDQVLGIAGSVANIAKLYKSYK